MNPLRLEHLRILLARARREHPDTTPLETRPAMTAGDIHEQAEAARAALSPAPAAPATPRRKVH